MAPATAGQTAAPGTSTVTTTQPTSIDGLASGRQDSRKGEGSQTRSESAGAATPNGSRPRQAARASSQNGSSAPADRYHTDGRVRNPTPKQLKSFDKGNGSFQLMKLDLTKSEASQRDAAAKRTSEGIEAAAKKANENGYRSVRRSQHEYIPAEKDSEVAATWHRMPPPLPPAVSTPAPVQIPSGLSPQDAKDEQGRLLTLLRSLHPVLVVDQLCKALAFFGGVPGAPPSAPGGFPVSAGNNGSGSLLVSWLSEVFPSTEPGAISTGHPALGPAGSLSDGSVALAALISPRRSRGRPRGSKSSHPRKDKGTKKSGQAQNGSASGAIDLTDEVDDEDVTPAPQESPPVEQAQVSATPTQNETSQQPAQQSTSTVTPSGKKRGRPKGSKNRPKPPPTPTQAGPAPTGSTAPTTDLAPTASVATQSHLPSQAQANGGGNAALSSQAPPVAGQLANVSSNAVQTETRAPLPEAPQDGARKKANSCKRKAPPSTQAMTIQTELQQPPQALLSAAAQDANPAASQPPKAKRQRKSKQPSSSTAPSSTGALMQNSVTTAAESPVVDFGMAAPTATMTTNDFGLPVVSPNVTLSQNQGVSGRQGHNMQRPQHQYRQRQLSQGQSQAQLPNLMAANQQSHRRTSMNVPQRPPLPLPASFDTNQTNHQTQAQNQANDRQAFFNLQRQMAGQFGQAFHQQQQQQNNARHQQQMHTPSGPAGGPGQAQDMSFAHANFVGQGFMGMDYGADFGRGEMARQNFHS